MFKAINPATGEFVRSLEIDDDANVQQKLKLAQKAFKVWSKVPISERCSLLSEAAKILDKNREEYARLIVEEMGKTITAARKEIDKCSLVCNYYAKEAERMLTPQIIETEAKKSYVSYRPMGALLAIMPWNFPFWQVFRFAAPNIAAGNIILLKHASSVPGCTVAIDDIFFKAGFPEDILIPLYIEHDKIENIISNPIVKGVTLTGSTAAGKNVAQLAGKHLKKSVLELGGSDPFIILEDADVEQAAKICVKSRLKNMGQSCIGAKRIIVVESIYDDFLAAFHREFATVNFGNPNKEDSDLGPMAREDLRDTLHKQVEESILGGATCLLGGEIPWDKGAWYPPTILTNVRKGQPAYKEELFGPVACIIKVRDETEAIWVANDTSYGLGAAVFTADKERGERIAQEELNAGSCFVNEMVKSHPKLPFGGIKNSGYGRELGAWGIHEFVNIKTIWVD